MGRQVLDYFLGRLGTQRWKRLQRWNYALFALVILHGVAFQIIEKRKAAFVIALSVLVIASLALQLRGFIRRRAALSGGTHAVPGCAA
jgi:methionine sulfoxide reductase heme-binding subunit